MASESIPTFKILTIGESEVGKTSILRRFVQNKFVKNHLSTIGIDYLTKTVNIYGKEIKLKIWDTAGQERYHYITNQVFKGADGVILVYDVNEENSFSKITNWSEQINTNASEEEITLILIGNKIDMSNRAVSKEKGQEKANSLNIGYYETSALNGIGINEAFEGLTKEIMKKKKMINNGRNSISLVHTQSSKKKKRKRCCH